MRRIVATTPSFCKYIKSPLQQLKENGFEVIYDLGLKDYINYGQETLDEIEAIIVGLEKIDAGVLNVLSKTKVIVKHGAGIDNIDLSIAEKKGIKVYNVPGANRTAVADAAMAIMLDLSRRITLANRSLREGKWERFYGVELEGKTLSVIGFGAIGKAVAARAAGFGMNILAYDVVTADFSGVTFVDLEEAFRRGDYISLHAPLIDSTRHMINKSALNLMKETAFVVNTARGGLINEDDLLDALEAGRIAGAGIDVFEKEPHVNPRYLKLENVLLTPHLSGFSEEATNKISLACTEFILKELKAS